MVGRTLGHYRILGKLGAGGMGVVFRARDTRLERDVAVKVLGEHLAVDATARARLVREARTASALNHPNICTIHEVGEADGQTFIVMEFVEGRPLSEVAGPSGLPIEMVIRYGIQIADALAHAHERGVVHRDLKGANVMIARDGRAKVMDFGLAKRLPGADEATRTEASLTEVGSVAGTLAYMAPELLRGEPADTRSDLWALGVALYQAATGALPFTGQTPFDLSSAILREPVGPPAGTPAGFGMIVQHCLAKDPAQRYQRAGEVRAALEMLEPHSAVKAAGPVSRRRWLWAVAGGAAAAAAAWIASVSLQRRQKPAAPAGSGPSSRGRPSANREANEYLEQAMLFLRVQGDLHKARQALERALELDPKFAEARGWYGFTNILLIGFGYSNDNSWFYKAEAELRRALQDDPDSARVHSALAAVYLYQGRKELVKPEAEKALKVDPQDPEALIWLVNYHAYNGEYEAAKRIAEQMMEREPLFYPPRMHFGDFLRQQGDLAGAARALEKVLETSPQNVLAIDRLSQVHLDSGDLASARRTLERARPQDRRNYLLRIPWALLLALEGKPAEARQEMDPELEKYAAVSLFSAAAVAGFWAVLGEVSKSLDWLDRAVRNGDDRAEWFRRYPLLANVRNHPRFGQILGSIAYRRPQRKASP